MIRRPVDNIVEEKGWLFMYIIDVEEGCEEIMRRKKMMKEK